MKAALAIGCGEHLGVLAEDLLPLEANQAAIMERPDFEGVSGWLAANPEVVLVVACVRSTDLKALHEIQTLRDGHRRATVVALFDVARDRDTARSTVAGLLSSFLPAGNAVEGLPRTMPAPNQERPETLGYRLTPRQQDVLYLIREGQSNKQIARALDLSEGTVKIHCMAIFRELGVSNRTQAAILAEKFALEKPESPSPPDLVACSG